MTQLSDVWILDTQAEEIASEALSHIAQNALAGYAPAQDYLTQLWDDESWLSIKDKLNTEGSSWCVWWMDGVRQHILNQGKSLLSY